MIVPSVSRYETVTCAVCEGSGLASSRNMSKKLPVAPSAKNQCPEGCVTPALSCPPANGSSGREKYIARSAMIGTLFNDVITAETSVAERPGSSSTEIVRRECAETAYVNTIGGCGAGSKYFTWTLASVSDGFSSR